MNNNMNQICQYAFFADRLECFRYAYEHGCPCSWDELKHSSIVSQSSKCLTFALEHKLFSIEYQPDVDKHKRVYLGLGGMSYAV